MPTYTFKNKTTGEIKEVILRMSELDNFKEQNQELERVFLEASTVSDPYALGRIKPPHDFQKYVIGGIQRRNRGANKSKKWEIPREF